MNPESLPDQALADRIRTDSTPPQAVIDEYYRRCIPLYLDFIGLHWHTGFYLPGGDGVSPRDQERMIDYVADLGGIGPGHHILDVGCGLGGTLVRLAGQKDITGWGLTPVKEQQNWATKLAQSSGTASTTRFGGGHADALPFPDETFDHVIFLESPCHFADRKAFFEEAIRVLKPGGHLCGEDWLGCGNPHDPARSRHLEEVARTWAMPPLGTAADYTAAIRQAGFIEVTFTDLADISELQRGFCVDEKQQLALRDELKQCTNPLWSLTLEGILRLGEAVAAKVFTVGAFDATKPSS